MKTIVIALIIVSLSQHLLYGETDPVGSLKIRLDRSAELEKTKILNELSDMSGSSDDPEQPAEYQRLIEPVIGQDTIKIVLRYSGFHNETLSYFKEPGFIFKNLEEKKRKAVNLRYKGVIYSEVNNYPLAREYFEKSLQMFRAFGQEVEIGKTYNNIGRILYEQARSHEALEYYQKALALFEELEKDYEKTVTLNNIAFIYNDFFNGLIALEYSQRALEISRKIENSRMISRSLDTVGYILTGLERYREALAHYEEALELQKELQDTESAALILTRIGKVHQHLGLYKIALRYHFESEALLKDISNPLGKMHVYNNIGKTFLELHDYKQSEQFLQKSHTIGENSKHVDKGALSGNYLISSELYAVLGDYEKAYKYRLEYAKIINTMYAENAEKMVRALENKYRSDLLQERSGRQDNNIKVTLFICLAVLLLLFIVLLSIFFRQKLGIKQLSGRINYFLQLTHQIKSPLTLMSTYFSSYMDKQEPSESLDLIRFNLDTMNRYVSNFFTLEKLERGELVYKESRAIDLNAFCEKMTALAEPACRKKDISIVYTGPPDRMLIGFDPAALNTVLHNILLNAVSYTGGGRIEVILQEKDEKALLIVQDTGVGIDPADIDSLFNPFIKPGRGSSEKLGAGLSIVKKILDQFGGTIEINSNPGTGTQCLIYFVRSQTDSPIIEEENVNLSQIRVPVPGEHKKVRHYKKMPTILIVDDNPDLAWAVRDLFMEAGYNAYTAHNGKEALIKLKVIPRPDVIISEINMQPVDGRKLLYHISKNMSLDGTHFEPPLNTVPFIFLSAYSADDMMVKGLQLGAVEYIPKPFDNRKLVAQVTSLVRFTEKQRKAVRNDSARITEEIKECPINEEISLKYGITPTQKRILKLRQKGLTYPAIAKALGITASAVGSQVYLIKQKTGINDLNQIICLFFYGNQVG